MTINKSQEQTLQKIYLPNPAFAHEQLYVAFSRATKRKNVKVKIDESSNQGHLIEGNTKSYTTNVIDREVLEIDT